MMLDPPVDNVDILVCSFGVISKLTSVGVYKLNYVKYIVLDEADALFHYTFEDKLNVFMRRLPVCKKNILPYSNAFEGVPLFILMLYRSVTIKKWMKLDFLNHLNLS